MQKGKAELPIMSTLRILAAVLIAACSFLSACSKQKTSVVEAPPSTPAVPSDQPQQMAKLPAPQMNEVQEAVKRVFRDAAVIDSSHTPAFIAGDFNGDLSQDIAVVLKPAPDKLAELNEEFPAWILRDPFGAVEARAPRLRIADKEVLLAVIH